MCGIVGVVTKHKSSGFLKQHEDVFKQLLFVDTLRGDDSTGIIGVEKDNAFHIAKEATEATWFLQQFFGGKVANELYRNGVAYIGHNRKKTIGAVADETAHPFVVNDNFALVHNGTLHNHKALADKAVDSEALAHHLAPVFDNEDPEQLKLALEEAIGKVYGAYALAMYSQKRHKVYLLRNKERPLAIAETNNGWYWASEAGALYWILGRNGFVAKDVKLEIVPEDTLITLDLEKGTIALEKITPKKPTPPTTYSKVYTGATTATKSYSSSKKGGVQQVGMSKNEFKRIKRKLLGARVDFEVCDYIETNYPRTAERDGEKLFRLMGTTDTIAHPHLLHAQVDTELLGIKCDRFDKLLWSARVDDIAYCTRSHMLDITLDKAVPYPEHKPKLTVVKGTTPALPAPINIPVINAEYIKKALDEKDAKAAQETRTVEPTLH